VKEKAPKPEKHAWVYLWPRFASVTRCITNVIFDVLPSFDFIVTTSVMVLPDMVARPSNDDPSLGP
jgi:hypothetical protein